MLSNLHTDIKTPTIARYFPLVTLLSLITMSNLPQFSLPDPLAQWPWPRKLNQHYVEVKPESDKWIHGFEALDVKSQRSFDLCNFCKDFVLAFFSH
jgi:hypothetical protein